jgi:hypothetical protein
MSQDQHEMTFREAFDLIVAESEGAEGMIVNLRNRFPPDRATTENVISAIRMIFNSLRGDIQIDRQLASALFSLALYSHEYAALVRDCGEDGRVFYEEIQFSIQFAVESILCDEWVCQND